MCNKYKAGSPLDPSLCWSISMILLYPGIIVLLLMLSKSICKAAFIWRIWGSWNISGELKLQRHFLMSAEICTWYYIYLRSVFLVVSPCLHLWNKGEFLSSISGTTNLSLFYSSRIILLCACVVSIHEHWNAALRVVRYLKGSPGQGILLRSDNDLQLHAWCERSIASTRSITR